MLFGPLVNSRGSLSCRPAVTPTFKGYRSHPILLFTVSVSLRYISRVSGNLATASEGLCSALGAFEQEGIFLVTRDISFSSLIRGTVSSSRLVRNTWGRGGPILTWVLTDHPKGCPILVTSCRHQGMMATYIRTQILTDPIQPLVATH